MLEFRVVGLRLQAKINQGSNATGSILKPIAPDRKRSLHKHETRASCNEYPLNWDAVKELKLSYHDMGI